MTSEEINIYCDESCHLLNENCKTMVVSCLRAPKNKVKKISDDIIALKKKHKIWKYAEVKWSKVSENKENFYFELLEYFFNNNDLKFRACIIDKNKLNHPAFEQNHNIFYYKMIYHLVDYILENNKSYNIYADKKDNSYSSKKQLIITKKFLQSHCYQTIKLQNMTSYKSQIMQLNDFLQGIVCYYNRHLYLESNASRAKLNLIKLIQTKGIKLDITNYNDKFNLFFWVYQALRLLLMK